MFALGGTHSGFCLLISDGKKKIWIQETKNVGKPARGHSGSDASRASLFHTLKSDTTLSAVSRVTSQSDYSHADKICCPTRKKNSVTVQENTPKVTLLFGRFCFQRIQGQKTKISFRLPLFFSFSASLTLLGHSCSGCGASELMSRWGNRGGDPVTSEDCEGDAGPADTATVDTQQTKAGAGMEAASRGSSCSTVSVFMSRLAEAKLPPEKYLGQQKVHDCTFCQKREVMRKISKNSPKKII